MFGHLKADTAVLTEAKAVLGEVLKPLESHLLLNTWLVGAHLTLADVCLASTLLNAYRIVFDASWRNKFPNMTRWFTTVAGQTSFREVVGRVHLCAHQQTPPGETAPADNKGKQKEGNQNQGKKDDTQKGQQQQKKQGGGEKQNKQQAKKDDPKNWEGEEQEQVQPPKKKVNPLDELPETKFDLETWKRQ